MPRSSCSPGRLVPLIVLALYHTFLCSVKFTLSFLPFPHPSSLSFQICCDFFSLSSPDARASSTYLFAFYSNLRLEEFLGRVFPIVHGAVGKQSVQALIFYAIHVLIHTLFTLFMH